MRELVASYLDQKISISVCATLHGHAELKDPEVAVVPRGSPRTLAVTAPKFRQELETSSEEREAKRRKLKQQAKEEVSETEQIEKEQTKVKEFRKEPESVEPETDEPEQETKTGTKEETIEVKEEPGQKDFGIKENRRPRDKVTLGVC